MLADLQAAWYGDTRTFRYGFVRTDWEATTAKPPNIERVTMQTPADNRRYFIKERNRPIVLLNQNDNVTSDETTLP